MPRGAPPPRLRYTDACEIDAESQRKALMTVCKIYEGLGEDDPQGCADAIAALGLADVANSLVARKRRRDRRGRKAAE